MIAAARCTIGAYSTPPRIVRIGRALASRDVLREVLVAFEPAIEVARDHVRGMRDVAGHQRVDGRERGLDRLALERVAAPEVDQRVLELVLAREHARGERWVWLIVLAAILGGLVALLNPYVAKQLLPLAQPFMHLFAFLFTPR
jgi:hypothetical protein